MNTVRQTIDDSWERFLGVLDTVPVERLEEAGACGDWSVKDLMAHMAYWDDRAVIVADALGAGKQADPVDWEEVNEKEAALRSAWKLDESRREMHAAHQRMLEALERHPELEADIWQGDTFEHYDEHAADIRAWLASDQ